MTLEALELLLVCCRNGDRVSQKRLYQQFYGFGMSVCHRYAHSEEEAEEMCHDGFVKIFTKITDCQDVTKFKAWMRQVFVRSAIDYFRKYRLHQPQFSELAEQTIFLTTANVALENLSIEEKLKYVQQLPPACRIAFNLYALEGMSTTDIAEALQISEGTVRANLAKARQKLQQMIVQSDQSETHARI
jgi:RNA polymerase sigma-70 factor (ECF subfamily)